MMRVESPQPAGGQGRDMGNLMGPYTRPDSPAAIAWEAASKAWAAVERDLQQQRTKLVVLCEPPLPAAAERSSLPTPPPTPQTRYVTDPDKPATETELSSIEFAFDYESDNPVPVVLKRIKSAATAEQELKNLRALADANVPYVLKLRDTFVDNKGCHVFVFPRLQPVESKRLDLIQIARYIRQLATALSAVHALNLAHLDLSLCNLMVDDTNSLVLIDWGLSRFCNPRECHPCGRGTPGYIAPELYNGSATSTTPDIYSAGVILGQWLEPYLPACYLSQLGSKLVRPATTTQIANRIAERLASQKYGYEYPPWSPIVSKAGDLLVQMLEPDAGKRITAGRMLSHPFLVAPESEFAGTEFESHASSLLRGTMGGWGSVREKTPTVIIRYR
ncbi:Calcium/calmodulin-dependent protein kinase type IV [Borealophlyctis nickersoniae]|nr:Calcium/calmodulin-dependent protein kinase type IV [Borealophlyctis nickersoniae]